jgi:hypothetical protein
MGKEDEASKKAGGSSVVVQVDQGSRGPVVKLVVEMLSMKDKKEEVKVTGDPVISRSSNAQDGRIKQFSMFIPAFKEVEILPSRSGIFTDWKAKKRDSALHSSEEGKLIVYVFRNGRKAETPGAQEGAAAKADLKTYDDFLKSIKSRKTPGLSEILLDFNDKGEILRMNVEGMNVKF